MFVYMPAAAFAHSYNPANGDIFIVVERDGDRIVYVVNGEDQDGTPVEIYGNNNPASGTVSIESRDGANAVIILKNLTMDYSGYPSKNVIVTSGAGDITFELYESNYLQAAENIAAIQKGNTGLLTIKDDDNDGVLYAVGGINAAGIGGGNGMSVVNLVIAGGNIQANGGDGGAGIGGGNGGSGSVTISGGTVEAKGREGGAGIGGGNGGSGTVIISGGTVEANGGESGAGIGGGDGESGTVTINGGDVTATGGYYGAGIGGGDSGSGTVTISGGNVTARGGGCGAGIGGGYNASGIVTVSEGMVEATGGASGAGIGGGSYASGTVTINGGDVTATGGNAGAGIGGGKSRSGTVTISGGNVTATGGNAGAGIGGGDSGSGTVTISGGTVVAISERAGAGIGGGSESNGSTITVSGSANVSAMGGNENSGYGSGAAIGEGGKPSLVAGTEVTPDVSGLYTTGSITTYAVGTPLEAIKQGTASGNTTLGTVLEPVTNPHTDTTTPEEPKVNEPKAEEPKIEEPPVYTERSCIADVDVAALVGALLSTNASATTLDIEFEDNICLSPEIMTALFADNRVAKNCFFWHKGKRYVLHIGAVNKQSSLYAEDFEKLAEEPDGLAGFMMMAKIFANLGVTLSEIQQ